MNIYASGLKIYLERSGRFGKACGKIAELTEGSAIMIIGTWKILIVKSLQ
jgi:hypothetical protein